MIPLWVAERANLSVADMGSTVAPPPTPSINKESSTTTSTTDAFTSSLMHRLPPSLTFTPPTPPTITTSTAPPITLTHPPSLLSISPLGFFQITHSPHIPPPLLPLSAEQEAISLFSLPPHRRNLFFPNNNNNNNWPLGWDDDHDHDRNIVQSICLDPTCYYSTSQFPLPSLSKFSQHMEMLGLEIVQSLALAMRFQNPFLGGGGMKPSCLTWISDGSVVTADPVSCTRFYPYIVALQYQLRPQRFTLMADSGWVSVSPDVDSVLVTLGDIAEVWSNGRVKKVRGRPVVGEGVVGGRAVVMTVLISLPLDGVVVRPLPFTTDDDDDDDSEEERWLFKPFSLEEYSWRVYHDRIHSKDPLNRYRM